MNTCFLLIIAIDLSIMINLSSSSFFWFCKCNDCILIGIFCKRRLTFFLFSSRSVKVWSLSDSGISFVPGGYPGTFESFLAWIISDFSFASSLYFSRYFGTFPKFSPVFFGGNPFGAPLAGPAFGGKLGFENPGGFPLVFYSSLPLAASAIAWLDSKFCLARAAPTLISPLLALRSKAFSMASNLPFRYPGPLLYLLFYVFNAFKLPAFRPARPLVAGGPLSP